MAVPNTDSFSLQDVSNEIPSHPTGLFECFSAAVDSGFDPNYSGSKNCLANFRNYRHATISASVNSLTFPRFGGFQTFTITCSESWSIATPQSWITLDRNTGSSGTTTVQVSVSSTSNYRAYQLSITSTNGAWVGVTISQP